MNRSDLLAIAGVALMAVAAMALVLGTAYTCEASGGQLVRGVFWYVCRK